MLIRPERISLAGAFLAFSRPITRSLEVAASVASTWPACTPNCSERHPGIAVMPVGRSRKLDPPLGEAKPDKPVSLGQRKACKPETILSLEAEIIPLFAPQINRCIENAGRHAGKCTGHHAARGDALATVSARRATCLRRH
jgi:hypothetical protein